LPRTIVRAADWIASHRRAIELIALGAAAAAILLLLTQVSGAIPGFGYDGQYYARMLRDGFATGTPDTRLRPLIVLINRAADAWIFDDHLTTFRAMNNVYAFGLAVLLADLCRRYGATRAATATLIVNLFLCISVSKMYAFYPTLIDLGAYMFLTLAVSAVVGGGRAVSAAACVLAVLSREFGVIAPLFGIVRDLRLRRAPWVIAATYLPALIAFGAVRTFAASFTPSGEPVPAVLAVDTLITGLLGNLRWWSDPVYAALWVYFALTVFGGVSLFFVTTSAPWRMLRREPEWLAIIVPVGAITVVGYLDMWRYLAYVLPAVPVLWAWGIAQLPARRRPPVMAAVTAITLLTQRPWQLMDVEAYFHDWFPYYVVLGFETSGRDLLYDWSLRLTILPLLILALVAIRRMRLRAPVAAAGL
jgi:hypothetical protein